MDWSPIWSAAVAAGIVSAVANGMFALWRHAAETKSRRRETQHGHLRDAAAEFLAARTAVDMHREEVYSMNPGGIGADGTGRDNSEAGIAERRLLRLESVRAAAEAEERVGNALARLRLISEDIYELAESVINSPGHRDRALEAFVDAARTELGLRLVKSRSARAGA